MLQYLQTVVSINLNSYFLYNFKSTSQEAKVCGGMNVLF